MPGGPLTAEVRMQRWDRARWARAHPWLYSIGLVGIILVPVSLLLDQSTGSDFGFGFVLSLWPILVFTNVGAAIGTNGVRSVWEHRPAWQFGLMAGVVCAAARVVAELIDGSDTTRVLVAGLVVGTFGFLFSVLVRSVRAPSR